MTEPTKVSILNAITGQTVERELTAEEIAALPEAAQLAEPINE